MSCRKSRRRPPTPTACSRLRRFSGRYDRRYRFLVPSLAMHLRVRSTPDVVICEPWTSLICPVGHDPSSTRTRWPSRRSGMSCSRETCCAKAAVATSQRARPAGRARHRDTVFGSIKQPLLLALDLQPAGADIDLQALGFLPGFIEIVAEHADRDDQHADDEIQNVAIAGHPVFPPRRCLTTSSLVTRRRFS